MYVRMYMCSNVPLEYVYLWFAFTNMPTKYFKGNLFNALFAFISIQILKNQILNIYININIH